MRLASKVQALGEGLKNEKTTVRYYTLIVTVLGKFERRHAPSSSTIVIVDCSARRRICSRLTAESNSQVFNKVLDCK